MASLNCHCLLSFGLCVETLRTGTKMLASYKREDWALPSFSHVPSQYGPTQDTWYYLIVIVGRYVQLPDGCGLTSPKLILHNLKLLD